MAQVLNADQVKEAKAVAKKMHDLAIRYIQKQDDKSYDEYMKHCSLRNVMLLCNYVAVK